ncbi:uncharacterized protein JN550_003632 [Neoarthrinium moseri]|uniref:uncharacterized protein n=1 Tax=Neoarthrinium moseri TaxID=1658444 RepID=UPI001FDDF1E3|nr:uncharacterized protein JN550_003632 [Neoarthrinium moseri]KAI1872758.1 hypothetical protein JN550_003632 [Neoarthrinium moseri]
MQSRDVRAWLPSEAPIADIAGIGVFVGFVSTSCLALSSFLLCYILFHKPEQDPFGDTWPASYAPNEIDALVLGNVRGFFKRFGVELHWLEQKRRSTRFEVLLQRVILATHDAQVASSIALLIYSYIVAEYMVAYQWLFVTYVGVLAFTTSLLSLSALRRNFIERPYKSAWRVFLMMCHFVVLAAAMVPAAKIRGSIAYGVDRRAVLARPASDYFLHGRAYFDMSHGAHSSALLDAILISCFLFAALLYRVIRLLAKPAQLAMRLRRTLRTDMEDSLVSDRVIGGWAGEIYTFFVVRPFLSIYLVSRIYVETANSVLAEIFWPTAMGIWALCHLIEVRRWGFESELDQNLGWTFAQVTVIVLFLAPLRLLVEFICRLFYNDRKLSFADEEFEPASQPGPENPRIDTNDDQPTASDIERIDHQGDIVDEDVHQLLSRNVYRTSSWFSLALPTVAATNVLFIILLLVGPTDGNGSRFLVETLALTSFWYFVYQSLLLCAFFLTSMAVQDRVRHQRTALQVYRSSAALAVGLSLASVLDTFYGPIGGAPMSYVGLGIGGLLVVLYIGYGCASTAAGPRQRRGGDLADVEEQQGLLGSRETD